jgi:DNA-binding NtrC family response regulator
MAQTTHPPAILIVDDDHEILTLLRIYLHTLAPSYAIVTAEDAQSALTHLAQHTVPLLITDYMMPGMNGLQLAAAVKAISPTTYVIIVTAYDTVALEQQARNQRVDLFLAKDVMFDHLESAVRAALPAAPDG